MLAPSYPEELARLIALDLAFNSTLRWCRSDPHAVANGLDRPGADLRALCLEVRAAQHRYAHPG